MRESVRKKLEEMEARYEELGLQISDPDVISNHARYRVAAREHGSLLKIITKFREYGSLLKEVREAEEIIEEAGDEELVALAAEPVAQRRIIRPGAGTQGTAARL